MKIKNNIIEIYTFIFLCLTLIFGIWLHINCYNYIREDRVYKALYEYIFGQFLSLVPLVEYMDIIFIREFVV